LSRTRRILQEARDGRDELAERRRELIGPLRLSAPVSFGCLHLAPALIAFPKQHPRIAYHSRAAAYSSKSLAALEGHRAIL
jgi:DNA-binding transcriptional LysR family regulator